MYHKRMLIGSLLKINDLNIESGLESCSEIGLLESSITLLYPTMPIQPSPPSHVLSTILAFLIFYLYIIPDLSPLDTFYLYPLYARPSSDPLFCLDLTL